MGYLAAPGTVVYEEEPFAAARLLAGNPREYSETGPHGRFVAFAPTAWREFADDAIRHYPGVAFLHGRTAQPGNERLVVVLIAPIFKTELMSLAAPRPVVLSTAVIPKGREFILSRFYGGHLVLPRSQGTLKLFAGQPDACDQTHFTIGYQIGKSIGTIDGWLMPDDTVELQIRDGPALVAATRPAAPAEK